MGKIKLLEVVPSLTRANGITSFLLEYQKHINNKKFDVTYLVIRNRKNTEMYHEFRKYGAKIVEIFLDDGIRAFKGRLKDFYSNNRFDIVHCNMPNIAFIVLKYAKHFGNVSVRICHSHGTKSADKFLNKIRNDLLIAISKKYTNCFFACSELAGKKMFGSVPFTIIKNPVDYQKLAFDRKVREEYRSLLNVEDKIVIGNVGRYQEAKNQQFIIKIMNLIRSDDRYIAWIIGGGNLTNKLRKEIEKNGLKDRVFLLGLRNDVRRLYNAMDIFVLPSIFEGFPVVAIEAQANGLPCVLSDTITRECLINDHSLFLPIGDENIEVWANTIKKLDIKRSNMINMKMDVKTAVTDFENTLARLVEEEANK